MISIRLLTQYTLFLLLSLPIFGQTNQQPILHQVIEPNIKSVKLYRTGFELEPAYIQLNTGSVTLEFDDLNTEYRDLQYTLVHCDHNWIPSNLSQVRYLDGYFEDYVTEYAFSFNTTVSYLHYKLQVPNENIKVKLSGNYILKVYPLAEPETPIMTLRMVIYEPLTSFQGVVKRSDIVQERESLQEVDFRINTSGYPIADPYTNVHAVLLQNNRWDNGVKTVRPKFVSDKELVFDYDQATSFPAGNEFRMLDLKSTRYLTSQVQNIIRDTVPFIAALMPDQMRADFPYSQYQDINGAYIIRNEDGFTPQTDADYLNTYFRVPAAKVVSFANMYVVGEFNQWQCNENSLLRYDYKSKSYINKQLLKQGYYNYQIVLLGGALKQPDAAFVEGNFFQTENDYTVILYHKDFSLNYDRAIGLGNFNSNDW